jgi:hypothetical protein
VSDSQVADVDGNHYRIPHIHQLLLLQLFWWGKNTSEKLLEKSQVKKQLLSSLVSFKE